MMEKLHTVIAILEAKQGRENELESALKQVVKLSRLEETSIYHQSYK